MKKNLLGLFVLLLVIAVAGCKKTEQQPVVLPEGNFTGKFQRIHLNPSNNKLDTLYANLIVNLSASTGYVVLGDTINVHAGSKGTYIADPNFIQFIDNTLLPSGIIPRTGKTHLAGVYQYLYDGNSLKIGANNDTLSYYYELKKTP